MDQAQSLRQHFISQSIAPSFAFFGPHGVGVSSICAELAVCLAHLEKRPVLIDCNNQHTFNSRLSIPYTESLQSMPSAATPLSDLYEESCHGVTLLSLFAHNDYRSQMNPNLARRLSNEFSALARNSSIILVDVPAIESDSIPTIVADVKVLIINQETDSITQGYAMLKRLKMEYGLGFCNVLINACDDFDIAQNIFNRLAKTAWQYLQIKLRLVGFVPQDPVLNRAQALKQSVQDIFYESDIANAYRQLSLMLPKWFQNEASISRTYYLDSLLQTSRDLAQLHVDH